MSRDKDEGKRKRILQAATKVFSGKGYLECKISDIAREAQVADGTIYLYYKDKKALLDAVFEDHLSLLAPRSKKAVSEGRNALEKLRLFIENHLEFLAHNRELSRSFYVENPSPSFQTYLQQIGEVIHEGQKDGVLRRDLNPTIVKRALLAILSSLELSVGVPNAAEQAYELMVGGLLHRNQSESTSKFTSVPSLSAA